MSTGRVSQIWLARLIRRPNSRDAPENRKQRRQNIVFRLLKRKPVSPFLHNYPPLASILSTFERFLFCYWVGSIVYFADILQISIPFRQLRSSSDTRLFEILSVKTRSSGQRCFANQGPRVWCTLPHNTRHASSTSSVKTAPKT